MSVFETLQLNKWLLERCRAIGLQKPTEVQLRCIPPILEGKDCIGCAKTGSGKTAAFALPILQRLCEDPYGIFALVLTPTRELAHQIAEQFLLFGQPINVRVTCVTGGLDMMRQSIDLTEQPHILISTPGRLADHIESCCTFSLSRIRFLVLDEADRLLEDNFGDQLRTIFAKLPAQRQTLLFSATMTDALAALLQSCQTTGLPPFIWTADSQVATVDELDQRYILMPADVKDSYLMYLLDQFRSTQPTSAIMVFTNTCKYCQLLALMCTDLGFDCVALHSMIRQKQRLAVLQRFKSSQVRLLIATDVAGRGLDIPTVDIVINHNVPTRAKDYIHRVGRTARAQRSGLAITLVTQFDIALLQAVESRINKKLTEYPVKDGEIAKIVTEVSVARREAEIFLDEHDFAEQRRINKRKRLILQGIDPDTPPPWKQRHDRSRQKTRNAHKAVLNDRPSKKPRTLSKHQ